MNYTEALQYIHSLDRFGSRPGLDRVQQLFDCAPGILDQRFIHVAGTNGKGSVSSMLAAILKASGYKVGLFISPYIVDFRERIQINNEMISEEQLAAAVDFFKPHMDALNAAGVVITEFELITAVGFYLFQQNQCDIVVCEVGMGGLLDSTNLIPSPLCSVITRIAMDHTEILGKTLAAIAQQKCGIIKPGCVTASAAQDNEAMTVIQNTAAEKNNSLYLGDTIVLDDVRPAITGTDFRYQDRQMHLSLIGAHQIENLRCVLAVIKALKEQHHMNIPLDAISAGVSGVKHPARFECLSTHPLVILDGAHNPNGLAAFADAVRSYAPEGDRTLIIGMLADKDSTGLRALKGLFTRVIATNVNNPRALSAEALGERLQSIFCNVEVISSPADACRRAFAYGDSVFICGSLYLASEIRPILIGKKSF